MSRARLLFSLILLVLVVAAGCTSQPKPTPTPMPPTPEVNMTPGPSGRPGGGTALPGGPTSQPGKPTPTLVPGVPVRLSEGVDQPEAVAVVTFAPAEPLPDAALQQIVARLPAMPTAAGDAVDFAMRPASQPAPRPGETIQIPFPPPTPPSPPISGGTEGGPVEVLRYQPDGDVPLAPYLSVTFNQAMVALTGLQDLAKEAVPVKLLPLPPGKWRWVGTKTLMFEPSGRFPMATKYTAEIAAGTKSGTGGTLAKAVTWTFTTPPPQMQSSSPNGGPVRRDSLMFVAFDQKIEPAAVLAT
ncbi:MAG: Ig-like domain-containing protein, partial [Chloroflexi bacterium]|nr:Ig-like domain-containing protein [Chloroflexota bacterium]